MKNSDRNITYKVDIVGALVVLILIGAGAYAGVGSSLNTITELRSEQRNLSSELSYQTELRNALGEGEERLMQLRTEIDQLEKLLPESMDFRSFYKALNEQAEEHDVIISQMRPGTPEPNEGYTEMPVTLDIVAGFEEFYRFLFGVTNLPRLNRLGGLTISRPNETGPCRIQMTVLIYAKGGTPKLP